MKMNEIKKIIKGKLKKYEIEKIEILGESYDLFIAPQLCKENLNIYEGFLYVETNEKQEISNLYTKYNPPITAYIPRLVIISTENNLFIKDYRSNKKIKKTVSKINEMFKNKLKKVIENPIQDNIDKLFDRKDIIDEFYILYKNTREYLLGNITGIEEEDSREEFIDNLMMQMLTLWYLQEKGFFNNDKDYFINKFKEVIQKNLFGNDFNNYYEFLQYFFKKVSNNIDTQYYEDEKLGKVVILGPAVFINGKEKVGVSIPDECFYKKDITNMLINTRPKKVSDNVPLLNLLESRDWAEGNIDEYVLGAIYEKLITSQERAKTGAYYTPEIITSYISKNTIEPFFVDKINEKFNTTYKAIEEIVKKGSVKELKYLFKIVKDVKILDPAVGSGHFLESAINVLLRIYMRIWEKLKELQVKRGMTILSSDDKGEIKTVELLSFRDTDIDKEKVRLLIKFYIILSQNIYGVDINPSAIKVARARLFLTLAKHFKMSNKNDLFIRFPNVHFNLRVGNSLVGYLELDIKNDNPATLFNTLKEETIEIRDNIKDIKKLKNYIENMYDVLNIKGDIVDDIEDIKLILAKKKIKKEDFEKVLCIKEKLIKVLMASLNSQYAIPLNDLIREITDLFNNKLDEKFSEEYNISIDDLRNIKTFHWVFEFPEVILGRKGFDIVIGNPPYGNILSDIEKEIYKGYTIYTGEIASVFVDRSISMNRELGYFSFIITYAITFGKDLSETRRLIYNNYDECFISTFDRDRCRFFDNMTQSVSIMLCKRNTQKKNCNFYTSRMFRTMPEINNISFQLANPFLLENKVGVSFETKHRLPKIGEKIIVDILKKIIRNEQTISNIITSTGEKVWIRKTGNYWYNGWNKKPYEGEAIDKIIVYSSFKEFILTVINTNIYYLWYRIYGDGHNMPLDIMKALPIPPEEKIKSVADSISFTSKLLMDFLFYNFDDEHNRFNTSNIKPIIDICDIIIGKLYDFSKKEIDFILNFEDVIRGGKRIPDLFFVLIDYLLFSNISRKINFSEYNLIKALLYELYFKEKFAEDKLYPESKGYLLKTVSKHLKPIKYDYWSELYWRKQLEGNLTQKEEKELKKLEKDNIAGIEKVYNSLKNDKEIQKYINKIKSHPWVKIIEGENV